MEASFDESVIDFQEPKNVKRKLEKMKSKVSSKRKPNKSKLQTTSIRTINSSRMYLKPSDCNSNSGMSMQIKYYSSTLATDAEKASVCPTCGRLFKAHALVRHTKLCLGKSFKASTELQSISTKNGEPTKWQSVELPKDAQKKEDTFFCVCCNGDLTNLTVHQRNTHINRCFDSQESKSKNEIVEKTNKSSDKSVKNLVLNSEHRCLMCSKVLSSGKGLKLHMKHCQKRNEISTMTALAVHCSSNNNSKEFVHDDILSQIHQVDCSNVQEHKKNTQNASNMKKKAVRKNKRKTVEDYNEEMVQLTLRMSNNENLNKSKLQCRRKNPKYVIPVMLELSPNSKQRQLEGRLRNITNPSSNTVDNPNTPSLPASSLKLSSISALNQNDATEHIKLDDSPGPSGIGSQKHAQQFATLSDNINSTSLPSEYNASSKLFNEELQSPEVSSSNIKHHSMSDNNDSPSASCLETNADSFGNLCRLPGLPSKRVVDDEQEGLWSLASNGENIMKSSYISKNLLSQLNTSTSSNPVDVHVTKNSSSLKKSTAQIVDSETSETNDDINSTLHAVHELDVFRSHDHTIPGLQLKEIYANEQSFSFQSQHSEAQKLHILIDNPQFSDAKLMAGTVGDIIHLHKNILFCSCSKLLKDIDIAEENGTILHLKNYEKTEILPMVSYLYSGQIDALVSVVKSNLKAYNKICGLMERYSVHVSDSNQRVINVAIEQQLQGNNCYFGLGSKSGVDIPKDFSKLKHCLKSELQLQKDHSTEICKDISYCDNFSLIKRSLNPEGHDLLLDQEDVKSLRSSRDRNDLCDGIILDEHNPETSVGKERNSSKCFELWDVSCDIMSLNELECPTIVRNQKKSTMKLKRKKKDYEIHGMKKRTRAAMETRRSVLMKHDWRKRNCPCCSSKTHLPLVKDTHTKFIPRQRSLLKGSDRKRKIMKNTLVLKRATSRTDVNSENFDKLSTTASQTRVKVAKIDTAASLRRTPRHSRKQVINDTLFKRKDHLRQMEKENEGTCVFVPATTFNQRLPMPNLSTECRKLDGNEKKQTKRKISSLKSKTVYVNERLPRFKEREHIRNRPVVANMGRTSKATARPAKFMPTIKKVDSDVESDSSMPHSPLVLSADQAKKLEKAGSDDLVYQSCTDNHIVDLEENISKENKFRKVVLTGYASPTSRLSSRLCKHENESISSEDEDDSDHTGSLFGSSEEKMLNSSLLSTCICRNDKLQSEILVPDSGEGSVLYVGPMPITPMPNFRDMPTPEILHRAKKFGLKKVLGKAKLKAKLLEEYLYNHQTAHNQPVHNHAIGCNTQDLIDDDLCGAIESCSDVRLQLSRLSASTASHPQDIYSFSSLSVDQVQELSTKVIGLMHKDGTLLNRLREAESRTRYIKRGSRQDRARCWDIVTPGRPMYDPKIDSILCLSEEFQNAISRPLTACIVKHYISYKKYQFDCIGLVCDRMEKQFQEHSLPHN